MPRSFTARFALAVAAVIVAAIIFATLAAVTVSSSGLRYPFPGLLDRSAARFYVTSYAPDAGLMNPAHSVDQSTQPAIAIPTLIGLFLLGIVLGEAYLLTGSVYLSIGLHCGFVLGAKMWPKIILNRAAIPWWIAGGGAIPLVAGAVAWVIAIAIFSTLRSIAGVQRTSARGVTNLSS